MSVNAFPKEKRLLTKACFQQVFQQGQKIAVSEFLFVVNKNSLSYSRLGLVVSKKNVATAVARNRIKRVIRENFRQLKECITAAGLDVVVVVRRNSAKLPNAQIKARLEYAWKKISSTIAKQSDP